jgi:hypothetical protein
VLLIGATLRLLGDDCDGESDSNIHSAPKIDE